MTAQPEAVPVLGVASVDVTFRRALVHRCPFADELDEGTAEITWRTGDATLELHALSAWLDTFAPVRISHEEITAAIADRLDEVSGLTLTSVRTTWSTAGGAVVVDRAVPR